MNWLTRRHCLHLLVWTYPALVLVLFLSLFAYLPVVPGWHAFTLAGVVGSLNAVVFLLSMSVGLVGIVALLILILGALFVCLCPSVRVLRVVTIVCLWLVLCFFLADAFIFSNYQMHAQTVMWQLFWDGQLLSVIDLSTIELTLIVLCVFALLVVSVWVVARALRQGRRHQGQRLPRWTMLLTVGLFFLSMVMFFTVQRIDGRQYKRLADNAHLITVEARILPYYERVMSLFLPRKDAFEFLELRRSGAFYQNRRKHGRFHYPLRPLGCVAPAHKKNFLFVVLDDWRTDELSKAVSPHLYALSKQSWVFHRHYSGGNSTGPGIFSLFYGLPAYYWQSAVQAVRGPVFFQQLLRDGYRFGLFRSASLKHPAFDQTIFKLLEIPKDAVGATAVARDGVAAKELERFLDAHDTNRPFFAFIFFDATHNYCESLHHVKPVFKPVESDCVRMGESSEGPLLHNMQRNAVYSVDQHIARLIRKLRMKGLLDNTVIVVTGDHAEQFFDRGTTHWGHTSNYSDYQLHVPLFIYQPGVSPKQFDFQTTHYDVVPFLMQRYLGCQGPVSDYSFGEQLTQPHKQPFFIAVSYLDYAFLTADKVYRIYPQGNMGISNRYDVPIDGTHVDTDFLVNAYRRLRVFYVKEQRDAR